MLGFGNKKKLMELQNKYDLIKKDWMSIKDSLKILQEENIKLKEENIKLKEESIKFGFDKKITLEKEIKSLEKIEGEKKIIINSFNKDIEKLIKKINELQREYEEEANYKECGLYNPKYECCISGNSEFYKEELKTIRNGQKEWIKNKWAISYQDWVVNGDKQEGKKMTNDMIKLCLRAFNTECDNIILTTKYNGLRSNEGKIRKLYEDINKLGNHTKVKITDGYLALKLKELKLVYRYIVKKQEEKEEQARIKQQMKEEQEEQKKLEAEIKREMEKLNKEEKHFNQELAKLNKKLKEKDTDNEELLREIELLKQQLKDNENNKQDILNIKEKTRAGYVYIISNIGSFGENVYKIGMTRRLNPEDRVNELGNASVPFKFDIHGMIFSEDAPKLERDIHQLLDKKRVNKVNLRKEFFNVTLEEIEDIVKNKLGKKVDITKIAEAKEYYESI